MDMSVYERLIQEDVETLGYFHQGTKYQQLALLSGQPHLAAIGAPPLRLEPLDAEGFVQVATRLLEAATAHPADTVLGPANSFPAPLLRHRKRTRPRSFCKRGLISALTQRPPVDTPSWRTGGYKGVTSGRLASSRGSRSPVELGRERPERDKRRIRGCREGGEGSKVWTTCQRPASTSCKPRLRS